MFASTVSTPGADRDGHLKCGEGREPYPEGDAALHAMGDDAETCCRDNDCTEGWPGLGVGDLGVAEVDVEARRPRLDLAALQGLDERRPRVFRVTAPPRELVVAREAR